jgi:hypothetical protein
MGDARQRKTIGNRFRFLIRALGLLGVAALTVGAVLYASVFPNPAEWSHDEFRHAMHGASGELAMRAATVITVSAGAVLLAVVVEFLSALFLAASRRTAAGTAATVSILAAIVLLVSINAWSLDHYERRDLTRDRQFTLPANVADELKKLRADEPTTIVVLQMHRTFGVASEVRDSYASESEAKVAEKVRDLVDQFREFGPRFNVVVLDTEKFGYENQVADLTKNAPELKAAIDASPENSILFHANKRVQRLGFNEFLQLDRTASKEANSGRGNLVLLPQGVESFARRILAVQERRPKVALCVIHGALGTEGIPQFTHAGLKKTLTGHGFDVTDIVLKKWGGPEPAPAAFTRQESKIEEMEADLDLAGLKVRVTRDEIGELSKIKEIVSDLAKKTLDVRVRLYNNLFEAAKNRAWLEIVELYRAWAKKLTDKTENEFRKELVAKLDVQKSLVEKQVAELDKERQAVEDRLTAAFRDERSVQDRRLTDVKAKLSRLLADVDLLILPRFTTSDVTRLGGVPSDLHALDKDQVDAIRDYMKSGRPLLALLGTISEGNGPSAEAQDGVEKLIAERGIELGKDTVLYTSEVKQIESQGVSRQFGGSEEDVPLLQLRDKSEADTALDSSKPKLKPNPVGEAMRITGRSLEQSFDLKLKALRPVYITEAAQVKLPFAAEFILSGSDSWNEVQPYSRGDAAQRVTYVPKYEPTKEGDPKKGTKAEERRGPFPVAVAIDGPLPTAWFDEEAAKREAVAAVLPAAVAMREGKPIPSERMIVFGSGGIFTGPDLKPAQEKLLLHSVNWLLNRSDRLPTAPEQAWSYPRVSLTDQELVLWRWGTGLLMPLGVVIFGLFAVMLRRTR